MTIKKQGQGKGYPEMNRSVRKKMEKLLENEIDAWNKMNYLI